MIEYLSLKKITAMHGEEIREAICRVAESGWYLLGKETETFEREYADYCGAKHCIGVANGLDALTLILRAYKEMAYLHDGDEVIVPANTYIATILAITENNLVPVLVEPRIDTFQIDDNKIEEAITEKTRAVMLVNLYGYQAYTEKIGELCRRNKLLMMTDCAQSHGLYTEGDCAYSFYPGKNLGALGDAGAVTTNNNDLAATIRALGNYGSSKKYVFDYKGRNSRLDEMNAAVLSLKLKYLDEDNCRRQEIAHYYINNIKNENITLPPSNGVHHIFPILTPRRDELQEYLRENSIATMIHYPIPPHKQQCFRDWNKLSLPITEKNHSEELSLPLNQALTDAEVERVVETINNWH